MIRQLSRLLINFAIRLSYAKRNQWWNRFIWAEDGTADKSESWCRYCWWDKTLYRLLAESNTVLYVRSE